MRDHTSKQKALAASAALLLPSTLLAADISLAWQGWFIMLNRKGDPLMNSSIPAKTSNQYITPVTGTMQYDSVTRTGSITVAPFDYLGSPPSDPFIIHSASFVPADASNPGDYRLLGNMLYNWNGNTDISFSIVWDASGLEDALQAGKLDIAGLGTTPASDGSYTPHAGGSYLSLPPAPVATTNFNTTNVPGCVVQSCTGYNPSGMLPLIEDLVLNENLSANSPSSIYGIGGTPINDSGFQKKNINIEMISMQVVSINGMPVSIASGDMDENGIINMTDYIIMRRIVLGELAASELQLSRGDIADDNSINAADLMLLRQLVLTIN